MKEENRKQMIAAMQTIHDVCSEEPCNIDCPFYNNCFFSPFAWWYTQTSPQHWDIPKENEE